MRLKIAVTALAVFLLAGFTSAVIFAGQTADGKSLIETKCTLCHSLSKVTSKKRSAANWSKEVLKMKRYMIRKKKGDLTDDEVKTITEYLIKNYGK